MNAQSPAKELYGAVVEFVEKIAGDAMDESERDRFDDLCTELSKTTEKAGEQDLENGKRKKAEYHYVQLVEFARGIAERNIDAIEWDKTREFCGRAMALAEQTRFDSLLKFINAFGQFIDFKKTSDSLAALAEKATQPRQEMDADERDRFDANLNEAALAFVRYRAPSIGPKKTKKLTAAVYRDAQKNADRVTQLVRELGPSEFLLDFQEVSYRQVDQSKKLDDRTDIKKGRKKTSPDSVEIIFWLGSAWAIGARRPPGTSNYGPFVRFVLAAAKAFDPNGNWESREAIGDTIKQAVSQIKKMAWGKK